MAKQVRFKDLALAIRAAFPEQASRVPTREMPNWMVRAGALVNAQLRSVVRELDVLYRYDSSDVIQLLGRPLIDPATSAVATAESLWRHNLV